MQNNSTTTLRGFVALCVFSATAVTLGQSTAQEAQLLPRSKRVLTQKEQQALTPQKILDLLKAGNQRFVEGTLTRRNHSRQIRAAASGQFPKAVILSCLDARIPVEDVFDCGIGDLFVARVAGNFANTDILGSIEFGCKVAGAKMVLILGHGSCGAVNATIDGAELGNITSMLANIRPAVDSVRYDGERTSSNAEFADKVTEANVRLTMNYIRKNSPVLRDLEDSGRIKLVGAIYEMKSGKVSFLKPVAKPEK